MEPWKAIELKHALEEFAKKVLKFAETNDMFQYTSVRYVMTLNYDPRTGSIASSGLEVRLREEQAK